MVFSKYKEFVEDGDLVVAWIGRNKLIPLKIEADQTFHNQYGAFPHSEMIGKRYGQQISSTAKQGFIYLLQPTPELWTLALPHRTQIVYTPDISIIFQKLRIVHGTRVIEAGTGSASMSHALSRTVGPSGKLYSYEYHASRYQTALQEFRDHNMLEGINGNTHLMHRDVCKDGFEIKESPLEVDAIFLDLPAPWEAIPHLIKHVSRNSSSRICCFSPCMEQIQRSASALQDSGWCDIEMLEVSYKQWAARKTRVIHINDAINRLKEVKRHRTEGFERRKERQRLEKQLAESAENGVEPTDSQPSTPSETPSKSPAMTEKVNKRIREGDEDYEWSNVARVDSNLKSHTSYLLFAVHLPSQLDNEIESTE
ncbi:tRNA methyltransferase complex catalytic subunit Cpd1 [Schizosaccharomyces cryophilus OY26]|uniref:tRNA (adenine(58)-N(1))-methyltransferase catalytic subunit TRM61 n=1 Tax=Schizosaccharomyces cryophilus (strain OY26 / ATCC MYA-4695 / CBS 11777 / NBRC 106824 / NRRL Y48691) TaxID=653667 RepID=S9VZN0_SCHCR|nr:tRNA methyltransferase complex catalytic subunit Cpd1 [Schizosaccharomyces cryophilus OY26]EPY51684.1 tRNA methyltransferase complex catalytic subunit Cpd1 [Schizosaccharomyces cryophilus OY26]